MCVFCKHVISSRSFSSWNAHIRSSSAPILILIEFITTTFLGCNPEIKRCRFDARTKGSVSVVSALCTRACSSGIVKSAVFAAHPEVSLPCSLRRHHEPVTSIFRCVRKAVIPTYCSVFVFSASPTACSFMVQTRCFEVYIFGPNLSDDNALFADVWT